MLRRYLSRWIDEFQSSKRFRLGTWLEACVYYVTYYDEMKTVLKHLSVDDALAIDKAQSNFRDSSLKESLSHINKASRQRVHQWGFEDPGGYWGKAEPKPTQKGKKIIKNLGQVLGDNEGLKVIKLISRVNDVATPNQISDLKEILTIDQQRQYNCSKMCFWGLLKLHICISFKHFIVLSAYFARL